MVSLLTINCIVDVVIFCLCVWMTGITSWWHTQCVKCLKLIFVWFDDWPVLTSQPWLLAIWQLADHQLAIAIYHYISAGYWLAITWLLAGYQLDIGWLSADVSAGLEMRKWVMDSLGPLLSAFQATAQWLWTGCTFVLASWFWLLPWWPHMDPTHNVMFDVVDMFSDYFFSLFYQYLSTAFSSMAFHCSWKTFAVCIGTAVTWQGLTSCGKSYILQPVVFPGFLFPWSPSLCSMLTKRPRVLLWCIASRSRLLINRYSAGSAVAFRRCRIHLSIF